jgi:hypothetical protein
LPDIRVYRSRTQQRAETVSMFDFRASGSATDTSRLARVED